MSRRALAILLAGLLPAACSHEGEEHPTPATTTMFTRAACSEIAEVLADAGLGGIRRGTSPVTDAATGKEAPGCQVRGQGAGLAGFKKGTAPHEALFSRMQKRGWAEDPRATSGWRHGEAGFALSREGVMCVIAARWDPAPKAGERMEDSYMLDATCAPASPAPPSPDVEAEGEIQ